MTLYRHKNACNRATVEKCEDARQQEEGNVLATYAVKQIVRNIKEELRIKLQRLEIENWVDAPSELIDSLSGIISRGMQIFEQRAEVLKLAQKGVEDSGPDRAVHCSCS